MYLPIYLIYKHAFFQCPYCDFKTPTKTTFVKHLAIKHKKDQHGEDLKMNFTCDQCSFQCVLKDLMKNHKLRKHTSKLEMKWKCNVRIIIYKFT